MERDGERWLPPALEMHRCYHPTVSVAYHDADGKQDIAVGNFVWLIEDGQASIQADYMARGNPLGNLDIMAEGYEEGLGLLTGVAVDQHFTQRGRLPDLESLVARHPQYLGVGIDEGAVLIVQGRVGEVLGTAVHFLHRSDGDQVHHRLVGKERYDLVRRVPLGD